MLTLANFLSGYRLLPAPTLLALAWHGKTTLFLMCLVVASTILVLWYARHPGQQLRRDAALTLGLVGLAPWVVIGVIYLASLAGLTGA